MTNAEKFKEVFGFELKNIGRYEDGYYCIDSDADIECKTCPLYEKGCSHVAFINWWNSEYQGEPTIPLSVIEKMHDAVDNAKSDGFLINENGHMLAMTLTKEHVDDIIDKAVKEIINDR